MAAPGVSHCRRSAVGRRSVGDGPRAPLGGLSRGRCAVVSFWPSPCPFGERAHAGVSWAIVPLSDAMSDSSAGGNMPPLLRPLGAPLLAPSALLAVPLGGTPSAAAPNGLLAVTPL